MRKLWKVTVHEFKVIAANKTFLILTILGPFLLLAISVLPNLLARRSQLRDIEIRLTGVDIDFYGQIEMPLKNSGIIVSRGRESREKLDTLVLDGDLYGYIIFPEDLLTAQKLELVAKDITDSKILGTLSGVIGQEIIARRIIKEGFDPTKIEKLTKPPVIEASKLAKKGKKVERVKQDFTSVIVTGVGFTMLLYMTILLYGQMIGRSVLKEKTSKTVEIMLSSVNPLELLFGKLLGQTAASLLQYTVWIVMGTSFIKAFGSAIGISSLPSISGLLVVFLMLFFLLGFSLYAGIYTALGSAAVDETNLGHLSWPVIVILMILMVGVGAIVTNPASSASVFLSMFPLTSPIVMFIRIVLGSPKAWQIALSICILIATVGLVIVLSAKIFRIGILMTGKRFTIKEILKWIRA